MVFDYVGQFMDPEMFLKEAGEISQYCRGEMPCSLCLYINDSTGKCKFVEMGLYPPAMWQKDSDDDTLQ